MSLSNQEGIVMNMAMLACHTFVSRLYLQAIISYCVDGAIYTWLCIVYVVQPISRLHSRLFLMGVM